MTPTQQPPQSGSDDPRPLVALTLGDVAGIGTEVVVRAWDEPAWRDSVRPFVVGSSAVLRRAAASLGSHRIIHSIHDPARLDECDPDAIPCLEAGPDDLDRVPIGRVDARAGLGAFAFLNAAIDLARDGRIDAIVTLPLNKEALRAAGVPHPGHTEILAERCGVVGADFAMMLYLGRPLAAGPAGLGVLHATLHVPLRQVFDLLTMERVRDTIALADRSLRPLTGGKPPRVAVAGLNPHAGENGLFGDEESRIIAPAVAAARALGHDATGPEPADTLFARALAGDFDAVVAMYHDQGHVALKTIGFDRAVNVTLGLPIVRTSVAHGTAFDIAGTGRARPDSLIEAVAVAGRLVAGRRLIQL